MCLILFAYKIHPRYKLILAANRDEFYDRPTAGAQFWDNDPNIFGGRDLVQGGTWLGVTRTGRLAAVTNFRDPGQPKGTLSRGALVSDFLRGNQSVAGYLEQVKRNADDYTGFNLLVGDFGRGEDELAYFSNRGHRIKILEAGIYGLSNALLDSNWPKVVCGKDRLARIVAENEEISPDEVFEILQNRTLATDEELPATGVGLERERILSPCFIETPIYGTRSTSIVLVGNDNSLSFSEKSFFPSAETVTESFEVSER
jgi:uncharacterized protein with NRDE domain